MDTGCRLLTTGELASALGVARHKVLYLIRTRKIKPRAVAGSAAVYDVATLDRLRSEIRRIEADRGCR